MSGCVRASVRLSPANLVNNLIYHLNVLSCTLRALGAATYPVPFRTSDRLHPKKKMMLILPILKGGSILIKDIIV